MNRRKFIQSAAITSFAVLTTGKNIFSALSGYGYTFGELRKGTGFYYNKGGTIGWYISKEALVVIDSQFEPQAKMLIEEIRKRTERKIDVLFNTHHHSDHTSGNAFLKKYAETIVANKNCVRLQKMRNKPKKGTTIVTANETFDKQWSKKINGESLFAYHKTNAHTGGDAVLHFENANVAHLGDLIFNGVYPYIIKADEAMLSGWIEFIDDALNRFDGETIFIFGHASEANKVTGGRAELIEMRNYLEALLNFVIKEIASGKSDEEILKNKFVPGHEERKPLWNGAFKINLKAAIEEVRKG